MEVAMRTCLLVICGSLAFAASAVASPRVDVEESAIMDKEVIGARDPDVWQGRQVAPISEVLDDANTTDGRRSLDQVECHAVRVRGKREDGATTVTRMDWCE